MCGLNWMGNYAGVTDFIEVAQPEACANTVPDAR